jgi:hypothetical protein
MFLAAIGCHTVPLCDYESVCTLLSNGVRGRYDRVVWEVSSGAAALAGTGPTADHSTPGGGSGHFLLARSYGSSAGDVAALTSLAVPSDGRCVLRFAYYLHGADVGPLRVLLNALGNVSKLLWSAPHAAAAWQVAELPLPRVDGAASVSIVTVSGGGAYGNVALDDVSLTGCDDSECARRRRRGGGGAAAAAQRRRADGDERI